MRKQNTQACAKQILIRYTREFRTSITKLTRSFYRLNNRVELDNPNLTLLEGHVGKNGDQHKYFRPHSEINYQRQKPVLYEQPRNSYPQTLTIKRKEAKLWPARSEDVGTRNGAHFHQFNDHDIFMNQNYQSYESESVAR